MMFGSLGAPELLLIALIALIVFGTGRLPDLGRGLGEGIRNFRQAMRDAERGADEKPDEKPREAASGGGPPVLP
jgi:sec-independent protein translocase protein TatA